METPKIDLLLSSARSLPAPNISSSLEFKPLEESSKSETLPNLAFLEFSNSLQIKTESYDPQSCEGLIKYEDQEDIVNLSHNIQVEIKRDDSTRCDSYKDKEVQTDTSIRKEKEVQTDSSTWNEKAVQTDTGIFFKPTIVILAVVSVCICL